MSRLFPPTRRRLERARRSGVFPRADLLVGLSALVGAAILALALLPSWLRQLEARWSSWWARDPRELPSLAGDLWSLALPWILGLVLLWAAVLLVSALARGRLVGLSFVAPSWARGGAFRPFRALFEGATWSELAWRVVFLLGGVAVVLGALVLRFRVGPGALSLGTTTLLETLVHAVLLPLGIAAVVVGLVDVVVARRRYFRHVGMTHDELRRELRESEGSPLWRAAQRNQWDAGSAPPPLIGFIVGHSGVIAAAVSVGSSSGARLLLVRHGRASIGLWNDASRCGITVIDEPALAFRLATLRAGERVPAQWLEEIVPSM